VTRTASSLRHRWKRLKSLNASTAATATPAEFSSDCSSSSSAAAPPAHVTDFMSSIPSAAATVIKPPRHEVAPQQLQPQPQEDEDEAECEEPGGQPQQAREGPGNELLMPRSDEVELGAEHEGARASGDADVNVGSSIETEQEATTGERRAHQQEAAAEQASAVGNFTATQKCFPKQREKAAVQEGPSSESTPTQDEHVESVTASASAAVQPPQQQQIGGAARPPSQPVSPLRLELVDSETTTTTTTAAATAAAAAERAKNTKNTVSAEVQLQRLKHRYRELKGHLPRGRMAGDTGWLAQKIAEAAAAAAAAPPPSSSDDDELENKPAATLAAHDSTDESLARRSRAGRQQKRKATWEPAMGGGTFGQRTGLDYCSERAVARLKLTLTLPKQQPPKPKPDESSQRQRQQQQQPPPLLQQRQQSPMDDGSAGAGASAFPKAALQARLQSVLATGADIATAFSNRELRFILGTDVHASRDNLARKIREKLAQDPSKLFAMVPRFAERPQSTTQSGMSLESSGAAADNRLESNSIPGGTSHRRQCATCLISKAPRHFITGKQARTQVELGQCIQCVRTARANELQSRRAEAAARDVGTIDSPPEDFDWQQRSVQPMITTSFRTRSFLSLPQSRMLTV
jgi:hypothetical protein